MNTKFEFISLRHFDVISLAILTQAKDNGYALVNMLLALVMRTD